MPPEPPKLPEIKLPPNPLKPLRDIIRGGREKIENAGSDIRSLADELHGNFPGTASTTQIGERSPRNGPQSPVQSPPAGTSKLTSEETLAYQKREIGGELWLLEKHLAQGCRIPDKTGKRIPCDCCEKGSWIARLAYESIPIAERAGQSSDIFEKIARWSEDLEPMVTVTAVESGKYDYKKLSGEASALRKQLMGSLSLGALLSPKDRTEVAERATKILEEEQV